MTVVAPRRAPVAKLDRIRALGAELELVDGDFEMARERAASIAQWRGVRLVEDSLDVETCEGAATIGLELAGEESTFDTVLIALGGGAMATGVGYVLKTLVPGVEVICVQPMGAPADAAEDHDRGRVQFRSQDPVSSRSARRGRVVAWRIKDLSRWQQEQ